ncbi:MAG: CHAT domain-containing protein [Cyanobacteriota bacterium]|nr:CHAT domain-containing protein [Cyanobacteriota bacterium]
MARKLFVLFRGVRPFIKKCFKPIILAVLVFTLIVGLGAKSPLLASQQAQQEAADLLIEKGASLLERGLAQKAFEEWEKAEIIYKQIGNYKGIVGSKLNQGRALEEMGFYRKSCALVLSAFSVPDIEKCDELNLKKIEVVIDIISDNSKPLNWMGLESLGNRLRLLGKLKESERVLDAAWKLAPERERASIYLSLGNTARALASLEKVRNEENLEEYKQKSVDFYKKAIALADFQLIGLQARLNCLSLLREFEPESSELITASQQQIDRQINELFLSNETSNSELGYAIINYAITLKKLRKDQIEAAPPVVKIVAVLERAIALAEELENSRMLSFAKGILGEVEGNQKQLEEALVIALKINAEDIAYRWEWQIGRILKDNKERREEAIAYYASAFFRLQEQRSNLVALSRDTQFNFRDDIEPIYRQYADLLLQPEAGENQPRQENLKKAREVIEALQLAELDDFFLEACEERIEQDLDEIVNEQNSTAVIYSIILENSLDVIVKLPGEDNLLHTKNSEAKIDSIVAEIRSSLKTPSTNRLQSKTKSKPLYEWLIAPFQTELEWELMQEESKIKTLVFVLDDFLQNVPMAVLSDGDRYLIERYAIAVTPGLKLLPPKPFEVEKINALLAGASDAPSFKNEDLSSLSAVKDELREVGKLVSSFELSEKNFIAEEIKNQINSASINVVHIATHGNFSSSPEDTFLLDWEDRIGVDEFDNLLQVNTDSESREIELLILSACKTATSDERAALGLAGVAIKAGARSTIASLWLVNDASTAKFMTQYYLELKNDPKLTKAEALRKVQVAFLKDNLEPIKDEEYEKPYYWAPFILVGSWL